MIDYFSKLKTLLLTKVTIAAMLLLFAGAILRRCDNRKLQEITDERLKPGERAAIILGPNSGSVISITHGAGDRHVLRTPLLRGRVNKPSSNPGTIIERIDGARGVRISVGDQGDVSIIARTKGFCFEPGIGTYATSSNARIFVDVQWLFSRRHGVNSGIGLGLRGKLQPAAFVAYSYNFWSNTSLLAGYDTKHEVLIGLRVKF